MFPSGNSFHYKPHLKTCRDIIPNCKANKCKNQASSYKQQCARTCGLCRDKDKCRDNYSWCGNHPKQYCKNAHFKHICKKTCNKCQNYPPKGINSCRYG